MAKVKKEEVKVLEKDVVNQLISDWTRYFGDKLKFYKKEKSWLEGWINDITAYIEMELEGGYKYKAPVFIEVKFRSDISKRDLIYELEKAKIVKERIDNPIYIGVISDDYSDKTINEYLIKNNIKTWKVDVKGNNIETLTINPINLLDDLGEKVKLKAI